MIGHDQPAKLQTGFTVTLGIVVPKLYVVVVVFQVGVVAVGADVAPLAQYSIA
jgi:hypothetical protein